MSNRFPPIISEQRPADLKAVPYAERKVGRALPLNATQRTSLAEEGVATLADLDVWLARGNTFAALRGVGAVSAEKILAAYESMQR